MPNDHLFKSLHIEAYRGLRDLRLDGLGGVNVLVGPNNSGKSSVLESVALLARPLDMRQWVTILRARDPGRLAENRLISLRWCFPQFDSPPSAIGEEADDAYLYEGDIRMRAAGQLQVRELHIHCEEVVAELTQQQVERQRRRVRNLEEDSSGAFHRGTKLTTVAKLHGRLVEDTEEIVFWEDDFFVAKRNAQPWAAKVELLTATSFNEASPLIRQVHRLQFGKYHPAALEILRGFDPLVRGFAIGSSRGTRPTVYVDHERFGAMPLMAFGEGMRRALSLVVAATAAEGGILLVDEIEVGIHYSALTKLFPILLRTCHEFNVQLFVTTHSLEAIDAILASETHEPNVVVAFHLPAAQTGTAKRFTGEILENIRFERGLDIR
jgi:energy-coupling factor transporter ATP-binding protein EcfA2